MPDSALVSRARVLARRSVDALSAPVGSVVGISTDQPSVALTFDDGPDPQTTPRVLAVLAEKRVQATFFVLISRVRLYPGVLAETVAAGHEIALHGLDHRRLTAVPRGALARRMRDARAELEDRVGKRVRWFRPPYGAQSPAVWWQVRQAGLESVFWGPSTWDWKDAPEADRLAKAIGGVRPGSIVLAHDGLADERDGVMAPNEPALDRAAWTQRVLEAYQERGLGASSIRALLRGGRLVRAARFGR